MEKLVFEWYETDGVSYGTTHYIPFEYSSKGEAEEFILSRILNGRAFLSIDDSDSVYLKNWPENFKIHTLEKWWEKNQEEL